jgi:8-oxo-dGTP pyrophosphatase MutT (NUDIX family)
LLVDATADPWQVLMMRRPSGAELAPGAYVFPGGSVQESDRAAAAGADACRAAAVRELFEEVGILLARRRGGRAKPPDCDRLRQRLAAGFDWWEALQGLGLAPALDQLTFLARWITPEAVRRRFDARFYLARRPPRQEVVAHPQEVAGWLWITPRAALQELPLVYATRRILESVAAEPDISRLIARLRRRHESAPVMPRIVRRADGSIEIEEPTTQGKAQRQRSRQRS